MKSLLSWLFHPWLLAALGLLALSLVIWHVGPLVSIAQFTPLASDGVRIALIAALVGGYLAVQLWSLWRQRQANDAVVEQLLTPPPPVASPAGAEGPAEPAEVRQLRERFEQGLHKLRQTRFQAATVPGQRKPSVWDALTLRYTQRYLYQLPWYIFIGAPGSGKTTALLNAGLRFAITDPSGQAPQRGVNGVGGTRSCDWWFTDEAVLIDTAGRYTTQDSDSQADHTAWSSFLGLLKKSRPRQPVNGVLVTVSVSDLLMRTAEQRQADAARVRARVQELHEQLGVRFPIYLLVTKCDLLAGFMDYMGELDKAQRATPWGFTFALDGALHSDASALGTEFDALEKRLTDGLIARLQTERDLSRRARMYTFPQQFNALRHGLQAFVDEVFAPSPYEAHPLLRGVYFISGTQEGTPLDRMIGSLGRQLHLSRATLPPNQASGKSFFLERLLREVIFAESALGGTNLRWERQRRWLALGAYAAIAGLSVACAAYWWNSYRLNHRYVEQTLARTEALSKQLAAAPLAQSRDVLSLLPALDEARDLARFDPDQPVPDHVPWTAYGGLYQGRPLQSAAKEAYLRLLKNGLLPRIDVAVETRLQASMNNPDVQYDALKTSVMLHDPAHASADWLRSYVLADWNAQLPRDVTREQRAALQGHLEALLAAGELSSPLGVNEPLIAQARARLTPTPLAQRVYNRLRHVRLGEEFPDFNAVQAGGPSTNLVFSRTSGKPLTEGVPGFYTYDGYHKGFSKVVRETTTELAKEEPWVLGVQGSQAVTSLKDPMATQRLIDEVRRLYLNDYASLWSTYIDDLRMLPADNLSKTVQVARVMTQPGVSPVKPLLTALVRQTTLTPAANPEAGLLEKAQTRLEDAARNKILAPITGEANNPASALPGGGLEKTLVDDHFGALRLLMTSPDGKAPAPVDSTLALVNDLYNHLTATEAAVQSGSKPPPSEVPVRVKAEAARLPAPMKPLLQSLTTSGASAAAGAAVGQLSQQMQTEVTGFCQKAISGRYPLNPGSPNDVTLDDFARMFAPNGLMDHFVQTNLLPYVDTSKRPWTHRSVEGVGVNLSPETLMQFQRAADVRDTFFRGGSNTPSLRVDFKAVRMDPGIEQVQLEVDGQVMSYPAGQTTASSVTWPGARGGASVRLLVLPAAPTGRSVLAADGPWALLRLLDQAQITPGATPERMSASFNVGGRTVVFDVVAGSVNSPIRSAALRQFGCPSRL